MRKCLSLLLVPVLLLGETPFTDAARTGKIALQNVVLTKVNETAFSVIDVKKKMDFLLHQNLPHLENSPTHRFQFYQLHWRRVLAEMIDQELILTDAVDKGVKVTDAEVREEMEERFGPKVLLTLNQIGLSHEDAWEMVKNDLISRRMSWWFIHSKALQNVTPQDIKQAYRLYLKEHPPYQEWVYQVISWKADPSSDRMKDALQKFFTEKNQKPETFLEALKHLETSQSPIQISKEMVAKDSELSDAYRSILSQLQPKQYSPAVLQQSRSGGQSVYRIFYLDEQKNYPAPSFQSLFSTLQNELTQQEIERQSQLYLSKLRKRYGFEMSALDPLLPEDFQPFSLQ